MGRTIAFLLVSCNPLKPRAATSYLPQRKAPKAKFKIYCQPANISSHCRHGTIMSKCSRTICYHHCCRFDVAGLCQWPAFGSPGANLVWDSSAILASRRSDYWALYRPVRADRGAWLLTFFMAPGYCFCAAMASGFVFCPAGGDF